jgi:hypothetical protein
MMLKRSPFSRGSFFERERKKGRERGEGAM